MVATVRRIAEPPPRFNVSTGPGKLHHSDAAKNQRFLLFSIVGLAVRLTYERPQTSPLSQAVRRLPSFWHFAAVQASISGSRAPQASRSATPRRPDDWRRAHRTSYCLLWRLCPARAERTITPIFVHNAPGSAGDLEDCRAQVCLIAQKRSSWRRFPSRLDLDPTCRWHRRPALLDLSLGLRQRLGREQIAASWVRQR